MAEFPPNWAFTIYAQLWKRFQTKKFTTDEARSATKDTKLPQAYSRLRKDGWLTIELDPTDARKSIYQLKQPTDTVLQMIEERAQDSNPQGIHRGRKSRAPPTK